MKFCFSLKTGKLPSTWDFDGTPMDFYHWAKDYPKDNKSYKGLTMMISADYEYGAWVNKALDYTKSCLCQRDSVPGLTQLQLLNSLRLGRGTIFGLSTFKLPGTTLCGRIF